MIYSSELVIVQSALKLIERKRGTPDVDLSKSDVMADNSKMVEDKSKISAAVSFSGNKTIYKFKAGQGSLPDEVEPSLTENVRILTTAIHEIGRGLEQENEPEEQTALEQKIHNLLFLKLLLTHYKKGCGQQEGEEPVSFEPIGEHLHGQIPRPRNYDTQTILCGILPSFSKGLYFKTVLACGWESHLQCLLLNLDQAYSICVLEDIYLEFDKGDSGWAAFLINFILSNLVTVPKSGHSFWSTENLTRLVDILHKICQKLFNSETEHVQEIEHICFLQFLTVLLNPSMNAQYLQEWFRFNVAGSSDTNSTTCTSSLPILHSYFLEFGSQVPSFDIMLDLNLSMIQELKSTISFEENLKRNLYFFKCNKELWSKYIEVSENLCEEDHVDGLCTTFVSNVKGLSSQPKYLKVKVCSRNLRRCFVEAIKSRFEDARAQTNELLQEEVLLTEEMVNLLTGSGEGSGTGDKKQDSEERIHADEDISLVSMLWRIDNRHPGFEDCLKKILCGKDTKIWGSETVINCLVNNKDLLTPRGAFTDILDVTVWMHSHKLQTSQQVKQLVLDVLNLLPVSTKSEHIAEVYTKYKHWPERQDGLEQKINSALNRLTNQSSNKVHQEIHQLALQDCETLLYNALDRAHTSADQADIIASICQSLPHACKAPRLGLNEGMQCILNFCLTKFFQKHRLDGKEERNFLHFISKLLQCVKSDVRGSPDCSTEMFPLLTPADLLTDLVFPNLGVANLHDNQIRVPVLFALDLGHLALETVTKIQSSDLPATLVESMKALDYRVCILCLAEHLHECVVLWRKREDLDNSGVSYISLKEKTIRLLDMLWTMFGGLNSNPSACDWLSNKLLAYDWTVQIHIAHLYTPKEEYEQMCKDLVKKIWSSSDSLTLTINLLRFCVVNEVSSNIATESGILPQRMKYEELLLCLNQLLPNLTLSEWHRSMSLMAEFIKGGQLVLPLTLSTKHLPLVNLEVLKLPLSISTILLDTVGLLQISGVEPHLPAVSHCLRTYVNVLKSVVLARSSDLTMECQIILHMEVFLHVVKATAWIPNEILDATDVLLLDIMSKIDDLVRSMSENNKYGVQLSVRELVNVTEDFILDGHTRMMVKKMVEEMEKV